MGPRQRIRCLVLFSLLGALPAAAQEKRQSAVAGEFYPGEEANLAQMVDGLLAKATTAPASGLVALVAPHAGYPYSGAVAAEAYSALRGSKFDRIVIIAPSHFESFDFAAIYDGSAYVTPLGEALVDRDFAAKLARLNPAVRLSSRGHKKSQARGEHSLEVQIPFLQRVLPGVKIVPIVMGQQTYELSRALGVALAAASKRGTLIIASSDLSHYHPYDSAVALDRRALRAIADWDYMALSRNLDANIWEACGGGPIIAALIAAERTGAKQARLLKYANSGDVTPERSRVVGYAAFALTNGVAPRTGKELPSLNADARRELLTIAQSAVETAVRENRMLRVGPPANDTLSLDRGVFVTLKQRGKLRGCVGNTAASQPLNLAVRDVASLAALRDPRFRPVSPEELAGLQYEISVLSPLRRLADPNQVQVGVHGLVIRKDGREGLLLPQVATEEGFNREAFLENLCLKARLPATAWRDPEADLFVFTAEVFASGAPSVH